MKNKKLYYFLKYFFVLILLSTAIGKLLDNRGFAEVILTYQFGIPFTLAMVLGLSVSLFELFLGLAVLLDIRQTRNCILLIMMHAGYAFLALTSLARDLQLKNCGCFGIFLQRPLTWFTFVEDIVLISMASLFYWLVKKQNIKT